MKTLYKFWLSFWIYFFYFLSFVCLAPFTWVFGKSLLAVIIISFQSTNPDYWFMAGEMWLLMASEVLRRDFGNQGLDPLAIWANLTFIFSSLYFARLAKNISTHSTN